MMSAFISSKHQKGITLLELMISMVVGLVVIGAVSSIYLMNVSATANTVNSTRLIQTMNTMMTIMVNDIRRAGFIDPSSGTTATTNTFNTVDSTALEVHAIYTGAEVPIGGNVKFGSCILFAYDMDLEGDLDEANDNPEITGFRLKNSAIEVKQGVFDSGDHDNCNRNGDTWTPLNNTSLVEITELKFDHTNSVCLNTREPDGVDNPKSPTVAADGVIDDDAEANCYVDTPLAGDITVETREIEITMTGQLADDPSVVYQLVQSVRVRNDLVRER